MTFLDTYTYLMKDQVWTYVEYQKLASLNMCREFESSLKNGDYSQALSVLYEKGHRFFTREIFQALATTVIYGTIPLLREVLYYFSSLKKSRYTFCAWGNSHLVPFFSTQKYIYDEFNVTPFIFSITGASASGLPKLSSTYNLFEKIQLAIETLQPKVTFLNFGQVDIEIGLYYKKVIKEESIDPYDFIVSTVDNYLSCIKTIRSNVCILPISLPSIKNDIAARTVVQRAIIHQVTDDAIKKTYIQKLVTLYPSYAERRQHALIYNTILFDKAKHYGIQKLDTQRFFCKKEQVKTRYCSTYDPHYTTHERTKGFFTAYVLSKKAEKFPIPIFSYIYSLYKICKASLFFF